MEGFSIGMILFYLMCFGLFEFILNFVAREHVAKFGTKNTIMFGLFFEILYFI
ncbi:MAG: hypothetical protein HRU03_02090 [Nanoarchaeales archaeon]|nr:hypothetical protein [Nanoarchaeales archaeon]